MSDLHKAARLQQQERQLLDDIMAEIIRGKSEAKRIAFAVEIPKDRANQFILRYGRVRKP